MKVTIECNEEQAVALGALAMREATNLRHTKQIEEAKFFEYLQERVAKELIGALEARRARMGNK